MFQGKDKVNTAKIQLLRRDCEKMNMKDWDSVESFFYICCWACESNKITWGNIEETRIVKKVFRVFPAKFDPLVVAIRDTKDLT